MLRLIEFLQQFFCETKSQKGILIGKGGSLLKKIGTDARLELEKIVEKKVFFKARSKS